MGKLKSFRIILSSEEPAYYPGDVVEGQCEIQIAEGEFSIKSLAITLRGYTKVHWTESRNVGARLGPYTQHFMAGSEYMKEKKILAHPTMGADRVTFREGLHTCPFSFTIPSTGSLPSSFEGKYGSIRYWLRAELSRFRSRHEKSDKTKKTIVFLNPMNITLNEYQEPVESAAEKSLCCAFCTGGSVSITAQTDKSGYSPGDTILISAEFETLRRGGCIPPPLFTKDSITTPMSDRRCAQFSSSSSKVGFSFKQTTASALRLTVR
ncbi:ARRDC3 [Bugula neritina]|uniref:ARRDC3 n=1 Tax=Bugula neritina TaxID=10212 RepID=A0A7J7KHL6_BUGNE|nr:ARRDC3 [Bugula neritina]